MEKIKELYYSLLMPSVESLTILIPYYNDSDALVKLISNLNKVLNNYNLIIVDDGTPINKLSAKILSETKSHGKLIILKRNTGPQRAIATGLSYINKYVETNQVLIMDSDGEDAPENIPVLLKYKAKNPSEDIIVASRLSRENSIQFKILYFYYKLLFRIMTGEKMNFGNFSLISRKAVAIISNYSELWMHLGSTYILSRLKISVLPLSRGKKYDDKPGSGHLSLINHGIRSIVSLSELMIPRLFIFSICGLVSLAIFTGYSILSKNVTNLCLGFMGILLVILNLSLVMLFLGVARNAGEYNNVSYDQLIEEVLEF